MLNEREGKAEVRNEVQEVRPKVTLQEWRPKMMVASSHQLGEPRNVIVSTTPQAIENFIHLTIASR
jgi:hypothetical protein